MLRGRRMKDGAWLRPTPSYFSAQSELRHTTHCTDQSKGEENAKGCMALHYRAYSDSDSESKSYEPHIESEVRDGEKP